jgi:hypothetical protein
VCSLLSEAVISMNRRGLQPISSDATTSKRHTTASTEPGAIHLSSIKIVGTIRSQIDKLALDENSGARTALQIGSISFGHHNLMSEAVSCAQRTPRRPGLASRDLRHWHDPEMCCDDRVDTVSGSRGLP